MVSNRLNVRLRRAMEVIGEVRLVDDDVVLYGLVKFNELLYTTSLIPGNESKVSGKRQIQLQSHHSPNIHTVLHASTSLAMKDKETATV